MLKLDLCFESEAVMKEGEQLANLYEHLRDQVEKDKLTLQDPKTETDGASFSVRCDEDTLVELVRVMRQEGPKFVLFGDGDLATVQLKTRDTVYVELFLERLQELAKGRGVGANQSRRIFVTSSGRRLGVRIPRADELPTVLLGVKPDGRGCPSGLDPLKELLDDLLTSEDSPAIRGLTLGYPGVGYERMEPYLADLECREGENLKGKKPNERHAYSPVARNGKRRKSWERRR